MQRYQQRIAFERLLARLPRDGQWVLKGGLALQFRYGLLARSTKDLVDMIIIAATERVESVRLSRCVEATFATRGTHALPERLPVPPASWTDSFKSIARETMNVPTTDVRVGYGLAAQLWDPFLSRQVAHQMWLPDQRQWRASDV